MPAIQSMTAFARSEAAYPWGSLAWEVRSVNHRYLEVQVRLPESLRQLETTARELLRDRLTRGKVDCGLRLQLEPGKATQLIVNENLLIALHDACRRVDALAGGLAPASALDLLRWPGAITETTPDMEAISQQTVALLDAVVSELTGMRQREGEKLAQLLLQRLDHIEAIVVQLRDAAPRMVAQQRLKLQERIAELRVELNPERLEQEVAVLAAKADVAEELDRLQTHVAETRRSLRQGGACGRRLDFLMQEFNREANTLSSKSAASETTQSAVELKVLIEQMREQVQNIE